MGAAIFGTDSFQSPPPTAMAKALEPGQEAVPPAKPLFRDCWSCRILSGSALIGAAFWVYQAPRRHLARGFAPTPWTIFQLSFAVSLACWGVVILADPGERQK
ncbi:distal membrane-arm assembly complex protein 1 [Carettochelys insculpta]|uniref:distal membrane-arm assembly complex protein 1 n=1 Tax=Carettochelys insculpta TaxID=44489 RepID=UPI003EB760C0